MHKKITAILLAGIMACAAAGCGTSQSADTGKTEEAAEEETAAEETAEEEAGEEEVPGADAPVTEGIAEDAFASADPTVAEKVAGDKRWIDLAGLGYEVVYDLKYCGDASADTEILHLVLPGTEEKCPVVLFVHGGAWSSNNSQDHQVTYTAAAPLHFVEQGYAVALMDYTVKKGDVESAFPTQILEVKAAVRYLRSAADEYGLDESRIALFGESAGGMLADIAGMTGAEADYDLEEYGNMDYSSSVQAVIGQYSLGQTDESLITWLCGVEEDDQEEIDRLIALTSAIDHVDAEDPPYYLEHGTADGTVPYTSSVDLYNALTEAGVENCELHLFPGLDHAVTWFQTDEDAQGYVTWLNSLFGM